MDIACDECKEVFTTNTDLFNHQRVHKADKKSHVETDKVKRSKKKLKILSSLPATRGPNFLANKI